MKQTLNSELKEALQNLHVGDVVLIQEPIDIMTPWKYMFPFMHWTIRATERNAGNYISDSHKFIAKELVVYIGKDQFIRMGLRRPKVVKAQDIPLKDFIVKRHERIIRELEPFIENDVRDWYNKCIITNKPRSEKNYNYKPDGFDKLMTFLFPWRKLAISRYIKSTMTTSRMFANIGIRLQNSPQYSTPRTYIDSRDWYLILKVRKGLVQEYDPHPNIYPRFNP